jgi:hypothetical protein
VLIVGRYRGIVFQGDEPEYPPEGLDHGVGHLADIPTKTRRDAGACLSWPACGEQ